jgi:hypothetical protein
MDTSSEVIRELQQCAGAAFEAGRLQEAQQLYARLVGLRPESASFHFRLALADKYLQQWASSLAHSLRSLALAGAHETTSWNAAIAATALGDWPQARRQWKACGIRIAEGEGPIDEDFGVVSLRLNPWSGSETVYARRIDPARARIANVPLPSSGHRHGDLVLHDGAQVGERSYHGHKVPVFNELQRLKASNDATITVFVSCESEADVEALQGMRTTGVAMVEDWTAGLRNTCLRCTYGVPHQHRRHAAGHDEDWNPDRTLGVAASNAGQVRARVKEWVEQAPERRRFSALESREMPAPEPPGVGVWWRAPR